MEYDNLPPEWTQEGVEFEKTPTIPTADEILDVSFRRAATKRKEKHNKDRANEEFVRAVTAAVHDRLVSILQRFPDINSLPPFYQHMVEILYGTDRMKKALGAVGWAAWHVREKGFSIASKMRRAEDITAQRRRAVARISSIVHQIDPELRFLNDARNVLRKLPTSRTSSRSSWPGTRTWASPRSSARSRRPRPRWPGTRSRPRA